MSEDRVLGLDFPRIIHRIEVPNRHDKDHAKQLCGEEVVRHELIWPRPPKSKLVKWRVESSSETVGQCSGA